MDFDGDLLFHQFVRRFSRHDIEREGERVLKEKSHGGGSLGVFRDYPGGLTAYVIRRFLDEPISDAIVERLVQFYKFPDGWVPSRLLVREALAHTIQLRRISEQLHRELDKPSSFPGVLWSCASHHSTPQDAFLLTDQQTDEIIERLRNQRPHDNFY